MGGFSFFLTKKRMAYLSMLDAQFGTPKILLSKAPSLFRGKKILRLVESLSKAADWRRMV